MLFFSTIGNLGRDAELKLQDGREFVSFTLASTDYFKNTLGNKQEKTQWISCTMNGRNENLLPFLRKGVKVFIIGRGSARLYSSAQYRCIKAGLNVSVLHLELINTNVDSVPRTLFDQDGVAHEVMKHFYVQPADINEPKWPATMQDERGNLYEIVNGFVTITEPETQQEIEEQPS